MPTPPAPSEGPIREATERYLRGERRDALLFSSWGALNLLGAVLAFRFLPQQPLLPLALATIGALQLVPGLWAVGRNRLRLGEARTRLSTSPETFRSAEADRMRRLLEARRKLRIADAAFFAAFIAVVLLAPKGERLIWLAVPGQMALLPLLNVAMERRARRFAAALAKP